MVGRAAPPLLGGNAEDASVIEALDLMRPDTLAVMLYGSRARGTARPDSDIDLLAVVDAAPTSFRSGLVSINYYTQCDLSHLAEQGSLFILHLVREGIVVSDPQGRLRTALASYNPRSSFAGLRGELTVALRALFATDRDSYSEGLRRIGIWAARSAVYAVCAEEGKPVFEMDTACRVVGVPELLMLVRDSGPTDLSLLGSLGLRVLGESIGESKFDLATLAVKAWKPHPSAARLLESVIAGNSQLEYTHLSLPMV